MELSRFAHGGGQLAKLRLQQEAVKRYLGGVQRHSPVLGRTPTTSEIAAELGIDPEQVRECLNCARQPVSLERRLGEERDPELAELLEDTDAAPVGHAVLSV